MKEQHIDLLHEFLNTPLESGERIFERFAALPNAIAKSSGKSMERFVYVPGNRKDAVLLVAHIDTLWDREHGRYPAKPACVTFADGVFRNEEPTCGLGADDRAGCAMLWALKDSGHSLLIVDGEEYGKHGSYYLKRSHRRLYRQINRHSYLIVFDWIGTDQCLYNQVDNTEKFKKYINDTLGFIDAKTAGGSDLEVLCWNACGVNLGVGYHACHRPDETLSFPEWENTYQKVSEFLKKPQPKFRTKFFPKYYLSVHRSIGKLLRILKLK